LKFLNIEKIAWEKIGTDNVIEAGHQIGTPELLFAQITNEEIEIQVNKLRKPEPVEIVEKEATVVAAKQNISFDDFQKIDIRTGTILEAEKVAKTTKLLKLLIDTGLDKRTVVSGIAEFFKPEDIIGKQVSILINLEPRKIKNIDSQGMILMAENDKGELTFISPDKPFMNGAVVR